MITFHRHHLPIKVSSINIRMVPPSPQIFFRDTSGDNETAGDGLGFAHQLAEPPHEKTTGCFFTLRIHRDRKIARLQEKLVDHEQMKGKLSSIPQA